MSFIDIIFAALLGYAIYKGLKNGLFVEIASFLGLIVGIYIAIKFSHVIKTVLETKVSWEPKYIEITAFALTFIAVIIVIHLSAKLLTKMVDLAYLGWINRLVGAGFSILKTILALSIVILLFEKININNMLVKEETLDESIFYNPTKEISAFVYPQIEEWYEKGVQFSEGNEQKIESGEQKED